MTYLVLSQPRRLFDALLVVVHELLEPPRAVYLLQVSGSEFGRTGAATATAAHPRFDNVDGHRHLAVANEAKNALHDTAANSLHVVASSHARLRAKKRVLD